jgi:hypothetical protein
MQRRAAGTINHPKRVVAGNAARLKRRVAEIVTYQAGDTRLVQYGFRHRQYGERRNMPSDWVNLFAHSWQSVEKQRGRGGNTGNRVAIFIALSLERY